MRVLCEVVSSDIFPTLRSLITQELAKSHKLSQTDISKKLGITQPAVSQYTSGARGMKIKNIQSNKEIMNMIRQLSSDIASSNLTREEIHYKICGISKEVVKNIFPNEKMSPGPCGE